MPPGSPKTYFVFSLTSTYQLISIGFMFLPRRLNQQPENKNLSLLSPWTVSLPGPIPGQVVSCRNRSNICEPVLSNLESFIDVLGSMHPLLLKQLLCKFCHTKALKIKYAFKIGLLPSYNFFLHLFLKLFFGKT